MKTGLRYQTIVDLLKTECLQIYEMLHNRCDQLSLFHRKLQNKLRIYINQSVGWYFI